MAEEHQVQKVQEVLNGHEVQKQGYDWDERYKVKDLPWDTGLVAPELSEYFAALAPNEKPEAVLEVGCGTGTNAVWMAQQGAKVNATEIAPTALEKAVERAQSLKVQVDFHLLDICEKAPVTAGSQDFIFDRGVYHVIPQESRPIFVAKLHQALKPAGRWLCIAGSKDEARENPEVGPPQLSACELLSETEPFFELISLGRTYFVLPDGKKYLAWKALFQRRTPCKVG
jgi:SAM-dependent methyltransferase